MKKSNSNDEKKNFLNEKYFKYQHGRVGRTGIGKTARNAMNESREKM